MRQAVCVAIIRNGKVLIVRKKETWILPGGKPEEGELDLDCLLREIEEELPGMEIKNPTFYKEIKGRTPHRGDILCAKVYFAESESTPMPAAEVSAVAWTDGTEGYSFSDITQKIIDSLRQDGYLRT